MPEFLIGTGGIEVLLLAVALLLTVLLTGELWRAFRELS